MTTLLARGGEVAASTTGTWVDHLLVPDTLLWLVAYWALVGAVVYSTITIIQVVADLLLLAFQLIPWPGRIRTRRARVSRSADDLRNAIEAYERATEYVRDNPGVVGAPPPSRTQAEAGRTTSFDGG